jgi:hypothetical protein
VNELLDPLRCEVQTEKEEPCSFTEGEPRGIYFSKLEGCSRERMKGVPIERVSVLLGHQSVPVTEKHYNPWVRSRQEQLEADVASAWRLDPVLNDKNFGTNRVHFAKGPIN